MKSALGVLSPRSNCQALGAGGGGLRAARDEEMAGGVVGGRGHCSISLGAAWGGRRER